MTIKEAIALDEAIAMDHTELARRLVAESTIVNAVSSENSTLNERLTAALASIESLTAEKSEAEASIKELNSKLVDALEMRKSAENDLGAARLQAERFKKSFESQSRLHADAVAAHARTKGILEATEKKLEETAAKVPPETPA